MPGWLAGAWADLADLVLPTDCAGCAAAGAALRYGVCPSCIAALEALTPFATRPTPAPPGMPRCVALGGYDGVLREVLLGYKERGRYTLSRPLGALLARAVAEASSDARTPVLLLPVPATAAAARRRHGDHVWRFARHAAAELRRSGRTAAVAQPVRALPRPDSAELDRAGRAAAAATAFRLRAGRVPSTQRRAARAAVVLVDDIVTTGATLAAVRLLLAEAGLQVYAAAVLAATARRAAPARGTAI
ncbi:MAG TPA: phosphoribosyltransferase family protein [Micromonosporaceae bacterium]